MQAETGCRIGGAGDSRTKLSFHKGRDSSDLLGMREADDGPLPPDTGTPGILPGMLPVTENCRNSVASYLLLMQAGGGVCPL